LGISLQDLTQELSLALGLGGAKGVIVAAVDDRGPAHAVGLRPSDVILAINGLELSDSRAYLRNIIQISCWPAGDIISAACREGARYRGDCRRVTQLYDNR
jgi:S1-C subfamily serine protease